MHSHEDTVARVAPSVTMMSVVAVSAMVTMTTATHVASEDRTLVEDVHECARRLVEAIDLQHGEEVLSGEATVRAPARLASSAQVVILTDGALVAGAHDGTHAAPVTAHAEMNRGVLGGRSGGNGSSDGRRAILRGGLVVALHPASQRFTPLAASAPATERAVRSRRMVVEGPRRSTLMRWSGWVIGVSAAKPAAKATVTTEASTAASSAPPGSSAEPWEAAERRKGTLWGIHLDHRMRLWTLGLTGSAEIEIVAHRTLEAWPHDRKNTALVALNTVVNRLKFRRSSSAMVRGA
mmetsp:Transcript_8981/g.15345  ORF Transcript_8981/g.15345 Transcript_8981/m.15345 type:complete len:294 (-) Transcript_8981:370-1251(-)